MTNKGERFDHILISACFLGERVRYNGEIKTLIHELLYLWQQQGRLVSICPEVIAGLPVPRPPAEINQKTKRVITCDNQDVTEQFNDGAQQALSLCQKYKVRFALLKESSPSCGSNTIYDGTFKQQKINGEGITARLLRRHGVQVFSEHNLTELVKRIDKG
jgi:uncharacterized protein YbbK (DUF523 family)